MNKMMHVLFAAISITVLLLVASHANPPLPENPNPMKSNPEQFARMQQSN